MLLNLFRMLNEAAPTPSLNDSLNSIITKLNELMNSFWIYIVLGLAAIVVVWGAYVGIKIMLANRYEEKINSREMVKNLIIGVVIIFVIATSTIFIFIFFFIASTIIIFSF